MPAYQAFSDTHVSTSTRIIKMLCGGFTLALSDQQLGNALAWNLYRSVYKPEPYLSRILPDRR